MTTMTGRSWVSVLTASSLGGVAFGCFATARSAPPIPVSPASGPGEPPPAIVVSADPDALDATGLLVNGDPSTAAAAILALPTQGVTRGVLRQLESAVTQLSRRDLVELAAMTSAAKRDERYGVVYGELAFIHLLTGDPEEARRYALMARNAGVRGRAEEVVNAVLGAGVADLMPADLVIGALLPISGSPSNREYTRLFREGVEVAATLARRAGWNVEFVIEDNRGTPSGSARGVSSLVSRGAVAILGPLIAENMESAVRAAPGRVAFLSPTARRLPSGRRGVYSMGAGDPGVGRALAEAVRQAGFDEAVVIHARSPGEALEANAFEEAFYASGGVVRRRMRYMPGTTTFNVELQEVETLVPQVLVIAAPPADVELLAPQIAFFGLDTLDIQVAGTAAWTTPSVLESVERRHTDSVITVNTLPPGAAFDPAAAFVAIYEEHFRRTLLSPVPAIGFDLFRMALVAYGDGVRTSRGTVASLERLDGFQGATGTYSYVDGRVEREFFPVRIVDGELHPVVPASTVPPDTIGSRPGRGRAPRR